MNKITRLEVITDTGGREYVSWEEDNDVSWQFQDDGRTLKVFVNKTPRKTIRAQQILDATLPYTLIPKSKDRQKLISCVLREVVHQLQYYNFGEGEDMILDARDVLDVADEVEALEELAQ